MAREASGAKAMVLDDELRELPSRCRAAEVPCGRQQFDERGIDWVLRGSVVPQD
jgi:hypothetical protein